jgi:hypothetical protein
VEVATIDDHLIVGFSKGNMLTEEVLGVALAAIIR